MRGVLAGFGLESKVQALYNSDADINTLKMTMVNEDLDSSLQNSK